MAPLIAAAIIGAGATLASSGISAYSNYKSQEAEREAREKAANELKKQGAITDAQYNQLINQINQYYNTRGSLGTQQDVNAYKQAIAGYNPEDYAADVGEFNYGKSVEDFTNPYYAQIIGQTRDALQHSAAGAGLGRGTGAALGIAQGVASKSDELYNTALNQYNQDRQFEYQKYADAIRNNQNRLNALNTAQQYKIGLQGNLASDYYNTQDARMSDVMKAQQDRLNAQTSYASAISGLY
jgi:lipopolysaccharide export LptBFGC system permease protein LptF